VTESATIRIKLVSFILPCEELADFDLGRPVTLDLPPQTRLGDLTGRFFKDRLNEIGLMVLNDSQAPSEATLSDGDEVVIYPLIDGG